jgi:MFS family permease
VVRRLPRPANPLRSLRELQAELPRLVLVLAAGNLVASFGFSLFFPFLTIYLVQELGASAAQAGLVIAAYSLCSIGSGIGGGWLADRIGRRPVLIGSISATALLVASMAFAGEIWQVAGIMLLLGSIDPAFPPASRAAVSDVVEEARRPRAFGVLAVANALGWIAGPVIGAGLASILGYPLLFGLSGVLVGAYSAILVLGLPETRPADDADGRVASAAAGPAGSSMRLLEGPASEASALPAAGLHGPGGQGAAGPRFPDPRAVERTRVFVTFLPLLAVIHALTFLWVTTLPIHAAGTLGLPTPTWGLLFGLNGLLIVLFQLRLAIATEHRSKPRVLAVSMALYAAGLALVTVLTPGTAALGLAVTILLVTAGEMLLLPIVPAFVAELSPRHRRGTFQGVALAAGGLGSAVGPPLAGYLLDTGATTQLWLGAAAMLGAVSLLLLLLARRTDRLAGDGNLQPGAPEVGLADSR